MARKRKLMPLLKSALKQWDADHPPYLQWDSQRMACRAAFAALWFIENATEEYDTADAFFAVREMVRVIEPPTAPRPLRNALRPAVTA